MIDRETLLAMKSQGLSRAQAAEKLCVNYSSVYRAQKRLNVQLSRKKRTGRKKSYTVQQVRQCADQGLSMKETAAAVGATYVAIRQCAIIYNVYFKTYHRPSK